MSLRSSLAGFKRSLTHSYDVHNKIEVSGSAILHNLGFFEAQSKTKIIPVLKGNAYGHGIEQVTQALKPVSPDYVAVDGYFEALRVQASNSKQNVLVMGMIKVSNIPKLRLRRMAFVVHDMQTIRAFGRQGRPVKIHLELNSGMNRYGISPDTLGAYLKLIKSYPKLQLEGVMSHLADSDGKSEVTVNDAVTIFDQAVKKILSDGFNPTYIHIGQSAGSLRVKSEYANASRIGIGLYGINPYPKNHQLFKICQQLKPVLTLKSTITEVHNLKKGDKVSYNYTFTAPKDMRIGVLPLGYFEGVNRELSNKGVVKVGSSFQPIVGRLCMNHTIIDISDTKAKLGDEVAVYSANPNDINSITNISYSHKLFNYGLVTALSSDVRRELIL